MRKRAGVVGAAACLDWRAALVVLIASLSTAPALVAQSGGIAASEFAIPANGASLAGQAALASDPSTVFLNPAGMTRLDGSQALVGAQVEYLRLQFQPEPATEETGGGGEDAGGWLPGLSLHGMYSFDEDWKVGLSVTFPFGNGIGHDRQWAGRYSLIDGELLVLDMQPSVAYRISDVVSVGVGVNVQYAAIRNSFAVDLSMFAMPDDFVEVEADGWGVGATAGLLLEPAERTRVGVRYRSRVNHNLSGTLKSESGLSMPVDASLTFPHAVNLSLYQGIGEQWAVLIDGEWSDWSTFGPPQFIDTWRVGAGLHFRPGDRWLLQTGASWDSSAHEDSERTLLIATDRQIRISAGAEYRFAEVSRVGLTTTFADLGPSFTDVMDPNGSRIVGDYDSWKATLALYFVIGF